MYSFVLSILIHYIINTRSLYPTLKIFLCKIDIDAAYRRCSMASTTSLESMTVFDGLLLVALRLTFRGLPCPNPWSVVSKTIVDVGNVILHNPFWGHEQLFDPISNQIEKPLSLPDDEPFHTAKDLSVVIPRNDSGYINIYIDDNIGVTPDIGDNTLRLSRAIPLAI